MDSIKRMPLHQLGFNFIEPPYIPEGEDEYIFRHQQHDEVLGGSRAYRPLKPEEIAILEEKSNFADDWGNIQVAEGFDPNLVQNCYFYGWIRIGSLESSFVSFRNLRIPVGLYDSTFCSCDLGNNVVIKNVNFMAHHIVGDEVVILDVDELSITAEAKFGNGILKEDESENTRIWLEICNENGGRRVLPFEGMLAGDAYLWSKYRNDEVLMQRFIEMTQKQFDALRGRYGKIGKGTVIKYCKTIKDVQIGEYAYIKGANKLKNLTINSSQAEKTQIGEGCELVNGIIGYGCRIFYGVKAVRFIMSPHSNLKYGARLINSFLGSNATISCCEVLNSLIFSSHEQHHNNSFLCAALVMGQSNLAAGATIGSNHNSRSADGELIAKRGFWPGLSVSLKHNSQFGSFSLITKGDYPYEINLPFPFTLLIHDFSKDKLVVMPGYWFMYNMYALARNVWKFPHRDERNEKIHHIEYDYLAPDTVEEMFGALWEFERCVGRAALKEEGREQVLKEEEVETGRELLQNEPQKVAALKVYMEGVENSKRKVEFIKLNTAYPIFVRMIAFYGIREVLRGFNTGKLRSFDDLQERIGKAGVGGWINLGGQLVTENEVERLKSDVKEGVLNRWTAVHNRYIEWGQNYEDHKLNHALGALLKIKDCKPERLTLERFTSWLEDFKRTSDWILRQIKESRVKDYQNPFRKMTFNNAAEMEAVIGKFSDDRFIAVAGEQNRAEKELVTGFLTSMVI